MQRPSHCKSLDYVIILLFVKFVDTCIFENRLRWFSFGFNFHCFRLKAWLAPFNDEKSHWNGNHHQSNKVRCCILKWSVTQNSILVYNKSLSGFSGCFGDDGGQAICFSYLLVYLLYILYITISICIYKCMCWINSMLINTLAFPLRISHTLYLSNFISHSLLLPFTSNILAYFLYTFLTIIAICTANIRTHNTCIEYVVYTATCIYQCIKYSF